MKRGRPSSMVRQDASVDDVPPRDTARVKLHRAAPMIGAMSEVEALLSVDAGRIPPGTLAFFRKNADLGVLRARAVLASVLGISAVTLACAGGPRLVAALLLIGAVIAAVLSTPTVN